MIRTELLNKMNNLVNRHVKHYKEDFTQDKETIENKQDLEKFIWILRPCGTNIINYDDRKISESLKYYYKEGEKNNYYMVDLISNTVKKIKLELVPNLFQ